MAKVTEEKLTKLAEKLLNADIKLRAATISYLKNLLDINGDIVLDSTRVKGCICCTYDGGNHPEYASNAFSTVNIVYLKDNEILLDTEDAIGYSIDNISTQELYGICEFINRNKEQLYLGN